MDVVGTRFVENFFAGGFEPPFDNISSYYGTTLRCTDEYVGGYLVRLYEELHITANTAPVIKQARGVKVVFENVHRLPWKQGRVQLGLVSTEVSRQELDDTLLERRILDARI